MAISISNLRKPPWLLNGLCPYFTMFPIEYPAKILNDSRVPEIVLDPFAGRGTTLFAARMSGFETYGIDNNPMAVAISKAKLANVTVTMILGALEAALNSDGYNIPQSEFWNLAFEATVLEKICKIRTYLLYHNGEAEDALRGLMLGALHGPRAKKKENNSYLSNQMPRTYASKPGYSVKYWKKNNFQPETIDIKKIIEKRAKRFYDCNLPCIKGDVIAGDSRDTISFNQLPLVTMIITSPPYYGMRTYYTDQWLRNWFLGGPDTPMNLLNNQMNHFSPDNFACDLSNVWRNCAQYSAKNAKMFVRFGSIPSRNKDALKILNKSLELSDNVWKVIRVNDAGNALQGKSQAIQMHSSKKYNPVNEFDVELAKNA